VKARGADGWSPLLYKYFDMFGRRFTLAELEVHPEDWSSCEVLQAELCALHYKPIYGNKWRTSNSATAVLYRDVAKTQAVVFARYWVGSTNIMAVRRQYAFRAQLAGIHPSIRN
jgi:hypothetical protein